MILGERIRLIRQHKGLSQEYVANKMNISQAAYSKIERRAGTSTFYTLEKVALALDVSISFLVDINNKNFDENGS
jgi:transcriptional regulator with XRE-family HTH domain